MIFVEQLFLYHYIYDTQLNNALIMIKTPITLIIVAIRPFKFNHSGTLSINIQPMRILIAVLINAETIIFFKLIF